MNTISAIETRYKGYRFRSRLEARWAMFFDAIGVPWTYEPEPLRVAGEAYLPDFKVKLPRGDTIHEVKSIHEYTRIQPRRVYLAGKMKAAHDWRGPGDVTARETRGGSAYETSSGGWAEQARKVRFSAVDFIQSGPFSLSDDHGGGHSPASRHMAEGTTEFSESDIVGACLETVADNTHIVAAHISTADAFGTIAEIAYAKGAGRLVSVTIDEGLADSMRRAPYWEGHSPPGAHDLWFIAALAHESALVPDYAAAREFHAAFIAKHTPREYRLISGIASAEMACMTFGDPLDVANRGMAHDWGAGIVAACLANYAAAERVRAHRFDGR